VRHAELPVQLDDPGDAAGVQPRERMCTTRQGSNQTVTVLAAYVDGAMPASSR
jgi:hypothetical protein